MPPEDSSTSSPQEPAPEATQAVPESPSPTAEAPAETPLPETTQTVPEPASAPEVTPSEPAVEVPPPVEVQTDQPATPTAQIPPNEPIAPESEPIKPEPDPIQPPSSAALAQTGILHTARDLLTKARVSIQDRKRKKRDKIMAALNTKNKITNDEVEKLLHVSDATATRYLSVLVKEGKIKQEKRTGAGVSYSRAP